MCRRSVCLPVVVVCRHTRRQSSSHAGRDNFIASPFAPRAKLECEFPPIPITSNPLCTLPFQHTTPAEKLEIALLIHFAGIVSQNAAAAAGATGNKIVQQKKTTKLYVNAYRTQSGGR